MLFTGEFIWLIKKLY
ncbi:hypothetical protein [Metamycoplasma salivarium]